MRKNYECACSAVKKPESRAFIVIYTLCNQETMLIFYYMLMRCGALSANLLYIMLC